MCEMLLQKFILNYHEFLVKETYDKLIYHYTNIDTFKSIVKSQSIHATNISYVNDSSELIYAQNLFIKNIKKITVERKSTIEKDILKKLLSIFENIEKSTRYISCFSINGDLKYQWEHYGDNGYGVSIGFHPHKLKETLDPITSSYYVIYNKQEQEKIIKHGIKTFLDFHVNSFNLFDWNGYDPIYLIAKDIYDYCMLYLCHFKDNFYKNEKEYRFEIKTDFLPNYRPFIIGLKEKNGIQIPFIANKTDFQRRLDEKKNKAEYEYEYNVDLEYHMAKLPIEEIIIGYNLDFLETKKELTKILNNHKYSDIIFKKSNVHALVNI
jgi:hypothetical protein